jgi:hypothetical protein
MLFERHRLKLRELALIQFPNIFNIWEDNQIFYGTIRNFSCLATTNVLLRLNNTAQYKLKD